VNRMGKEKWGGVTSRFNTFVEDRKFSAEANKRVPRPPTDDVPRAGSAGSKFILVEVFDAGRAGGLGAAGEEIWRLPRAPRRYHRLRKTEIR
jgi:hypothetical protein